MTKPSTILSIRIMARMAKRVSVQLFLRFGFIRLLIPRFHGAYILGLDSIIAYFDHLLKTTLKCECVSEWGAKSSLRDRDLSVDFLLLHGIMDIMHQTFGVEKLRGKKPEGLCLLWIGVFAS